MRVRHTTAVLFAGLFVLAGHVEHCRANALMPVSQAYLDREATFGGWWLWAIPPLLWLLCSAFSDGVVYWVSGSFGRSFRAAGLLNLLSLTLGLMVAGIAVQFYPPPRVMIIAAVAVTLCSEGAAILWWTRRQSRALRNAKRRIIGWRLSWFALARLFSCAALGTAMNVLVARFPDSGYADAACRQNQRMLNAAVERAYGAEPGYAAWRKASNPFVTDDLRPSGPYISVTNLQPWLAGGLWPTCPDAGGYETDGSGWRFRCSHEEHRLR